MWGMADRKGPGWGKWREGVVIGVCSGAILAILTAGFGAISRSFERREQVQYVADLINYHRDLIYEAADAQVGQRHISRDEWRLFFYKEMTNTLDSVLSERSTRLSYDEVAEVKDALCRSPSHSMESSRSKRPSYIASYWARSNIISGISRKPHVYRVQNSIALPGTYAIPLRNHAHRLRARLHWRANYRRSGRRAQNLRL